MQTPVVRPLASLGAPAVRGLMLLAAAWLSGCASQPSVSSAWQEGASHNPTFSRVLVVGVSPDINQRCAFENFLVSRIMSASVKAIASCDVVKAKNPLTRESIDEAIASQQADAVVATTLVEAVAPPHVVGGRPVTVTVSVGVSTYPEDGQDAETLLANADAAMYEAKRQRPGSYRLSTG